MSNSLPEGEEKPVKVALPLKWLPGDELVSIYSNQLVITHGGGEFYIIFGEIIPPLIIGTNGVMPDEIEVKPVAKIVITPQNMKEFLVAIQNNLEKYHKNIESKI